MSTVGYFFKHYLVTWFTQNGTEIRILCLKTNYHKQYYILHMYNNKHHMIVKTTVQINNSKKLYVLSIKQAHKKHQQPT